MNKLNIIIYARLSKEEEGKNTIEQSKSIQNQIDICKRYIDEEKRTSYATSEEDKEFDSHFKK